MGLTKTVYNPAALKAAQKTSEEALKKKQVREMEETSNSDSRTKSRRRCLIIIRISFTGSSKATAGCSEEEARNTGEAH